MVLFKRDTVEYWSFNLDVFNESECEAIISVGKQKNLQKANVNKGQPQGIVDSKYRDSNICWLDETELGWVYDRLIPVVTQANEQFYKFDLYGFTEQLQFTEYAAPSGYYNYHMDKVFNAMPRKLSMVVQLTDENSYSGGDLQILTGDNPESLNRKRGTVLFFPSYMLHRVTPVTEGTRHSLVTWFSGPPFK